MSRYRPCHSGALFALLLAAAPAWASKDDPRHLMPAAPPSFSAGTPSCANVMPQGLLTVTDLIDVALCRNPITAASWAGVRGAAANIGVARGNYYPQITVGAGPQLNRNRYFNPNNIGGSTTTTSLHAGWHGTRTSLEGSAPLQGSCDSVASRAGPQRRKGRHR
jgi:outer membrane protein TolC